MQCGLNISVILHLLLWKVYQAKIFATSLVLHSVTFIYNRQELSPGFYLAPDNQCRLFQTFNKNVLFVCIQCIRVMDGKIVPNE